MGIEDGTATAEAPVAVTLLDGTVVWLVKPRLIEHPDDQPDADVHEQRPHSLTFFCGQPPCDGHMIGLCDLEHSEIDPLQDFAEFVEHDPSRGVVRHIYGRLHSEQDAAVQLPDGEKLYFLHNRRYATREQWQGADPTLDGEPPDRATAPGPPTLRA